MPLDPDKTWSVWDAYSMPTDVQEERGLGFDDFLGRLEECVIPERGWSALLENLDAIYPETIFPLQHTAADDGNGPQVLSLIRLLHAAEAKLDQITEECNFRAPFQGAVPTNRLREIIRGDA